MPSRTERVYFHEMLQACERVIARVANTSFEAFSLDDTLQDAIIYRLAIIGEAVTRVSTETQAAYPDVPWSKIKGFRNIVVHEYFAVDIRSVWDTATVEAPRLREQIAAIIAAEFPEEAQ
ncbi:MAG: hypothetical protein DCC58_02375 [Chloroflexi bacterium]|nr:MAG: hypothetical protein DCC58_02375 [Chloroflexota bacterium]